MSDSVIDRATERAWRRFQARLADYIAEMAEGDSLVVHLEAVEGDDAGAASYVRFYICGDDLVRAEICSDQHLPGRNTLDAAVAVLTESGWSPPTDASGERQDKGVADFYVDVDRRQVDRVAVMAVRALREVFGVPHPAFLSTGGKVETVDSTDAAALLPTPPAVPYAEPLAVRPIGPEQLGELVDDALARLLGAQPEHDEDGDVAIPVGGGLVWVRVQDDAPIVTLFTTLVHGVTDLGEALAAVAELNREHRMIKFMVSDDVVVAYAEMQAMPFAPVHLRNLLAHLAQALEGVDDGLADRLGGQSAFVHADAAATEQRDGLPVELMTLIHLDPNSQGLDADLTASVCDFDRDLVLQFLTTSSEQEIEWRNARDAAAEAGDAEEAAACEHEAHAWEVTGDTLRRALRVIVDRNRATQ